MSPRRAAPLLALLAALAPAAAERARPAKPEARICYLDLQSAAVPACTVPKPQAALR